MLVGGEDGDGLVVMRVWVVALAALGLPGDRLRLRVVGSSGCGNSIIPCICTVAEETSRALGRNDWRKGRLTLCLQVRILYGESRRLSNNRSIENIPLRGLFLGFLRRVRALRRSAAVSIRHLPCPMVGACVIVLINLMEIIIGRRLHRAEDGCESLLIHILVFITFINKIVVLISKRRLHVDRALPSDFLIVPK